MLILGRKIGERIILNTSDGKISVWLHQITSGRYVEIAIEAPQSVKIIRDELEMK